MFYYSSLQRYEAIILELVPLFDIRNSVWVVSNTVSVKMFGSILSKFSDHKHARN